MDNTKALDQAVDNLKQLVVLYGEITEELIGNLEESNRLLEEAKSEIERLHKENKKLVNDYTKLDEENSEKIAKIAELKQKKIPSIDTITKLMSELQDMLLKAKMQNNPQDLDDDGNGQEEKSEEEKDENPVFDLREDKASDEDGFNYTIM